MAQPWVFRVNMGSQLERDDQIVCEFQALRILEETGVTPIPYFVDDTRQQLDHGVLGMEFLVGEALEAWPKSGFHEDVLGWSPTLDSGTASRRPSRPTQGRKMYWDRANLPPACRRRSFRPGS